MKHLSLVSTQRPVKAQLVGLNIKELLIGLLLQELITKDPEENGV